MRHNEYNNDQRHDRQISDKHYEVSSGQFTNPKQSDNRQTIWVVQQVHFDRVDHQAIAP